MASTTPDPIAHLPLGVGDAAARTSVRLPGGRVGTLRYWPTRLGRGRGAKAVVRLSNGRFVSVATDQLARAGTTTERTP